MKTEIEVLARVGELAPVGELERVGGLARVGELERKYVLEVLDAQFRTSSASAMTKRLEETFAATFASRFAIAFANGTATMHAALAAAGIGRGDEVIVPPLTMASTSFAVLHAGAQPVFADIDAQSWTMDPKSVERCITPRTRALLPVAIYGLSPPMDELRALAVRHNLFLLEDDAQCFLGSYKGRINGSIADASSFSFQSSKHLTCGEGGMITTGDEDLADKIRRFNSLGYAAVGAGAGKGKIARETIQDPAYLRHASVGWNYRLAELCAAVALAQTERVAELVDARRQSARAFADVLGNTTWFVPQRVPAGYEHAWWTYAVKLDHAVDFTWQQFRKKYIEQGGDGIYAAWQLTYLEPALRSRTFAPKQWQQLGPGLCPVAEQLQPRLLQFKTNYFDPQDRERAAEALAKTLRYFG
jgi:perosamine synthetase